MPVSFWNASSEGRAPVSSFASMYSGQFDQLSAFSVSERSSAAAALGAAPSDSAPPAPHAAAATATPVRPAAWSTRRREREERARPAISRAAEDGVRFMVGVSLGAAVHVMGSQASLLPEDKPDEPGVAEP